MKRYIVSMAVNGRADVEVLAENPDEAFEAAKMCDVDVAMMDVIDMKPVNCSDAETGDLIKDY